MVWYLGNQDCFTESDLLCDDIKRLKKDKGKCMLDLRGQLLVTLKDAASWRSEDRAQLK